MHNSLIYLYMHYCNITSYIKYADDTVIIADTEDKLQELGIDLNRTCVVKGIEASVVPGKIE